MITRTFLKSSVLAVLLSIGLGGAAWATDIFLVASYDENDVCGRPQYEAAMDALKQGGFANLSSKG